MWYFITVQTFHLALLQKKILNRLTQSFQCVLFFPPVIVTSFKSEQLSICTKYLQWWNFRIGFFLYLHFNKERSYLKKVTVINQTLKSYKDMFIIQETSEEKKIPLDLWSLHSMIGSHHVGSEGYFPSANCNETFSFD